MNITNEILRYCKLNNVCVGVCNASPLLYMKDILLKNEIPFNHYSIMERIDPKLSMYNCESIIVVAIPYHRKIEFMNDDLPRGEISIGAYGEDYHKIINHYLLNLAKYLYNFAAFEYKIFVDTGPLSERALMKKCGIGWQGKNGMVISDIYGSFIFCGYILTSLKLEPTLGYDFYFSKCGTCNRCIEACPGKAIGLIKSDKMFDYAKCASYITQKKGELTQEEQQVIAGKIYGCDVCQNVCPYNNGKHIGCITEIDSIRPLLSSMINITNKEFNDKFKNTAAGWRGKKILKRNAGIALNYIRGIKWDIGAQED